MNKSIFLIMVCVGLLMGMMPVQASAAPVYIEYNDYYTDDGVPPAGDVPWLTALFQSAGTGKVLLTLRSENLLNGEFATNWYFNFTSGKPLDDLVVVHYDHLAPVTLDIASAGDFFSAGSGLLFPIRIGFPKKNKDRFGEDSISQLLFTGIDDLVPQDFNVDVVKNDSLFISAVHIQGTGVDGEGSAWVKGYDPPLPAPEPDTLLLMAAGIVLIGVWNLRGGRRRRGVTP